MKKLLIAVIGVVLLIALAVWSPWDHITSTQIRGAEESYQVGSLIFSSLAGEVDVYIDGQSQGSSKLGEDALKINAVKQGTHRVKLVRKSDSDEFYTPIEKDVVFQEGIGVVMAYEVGPTRESSMGYTLFATTIPEQQNSNQNADLTISTTIDDVDVSVDDSSIGTTPVSEEKILITTNHTLKFEKDGYLPLEFELFPADEKQRAKFAGANVTVEVDLYKIPLS